MLKTQSEEGSGGLSFTSLIVITISTTLDLGGVPKNKYSSFPFRGDTL